MVGEGLAPPAEPSQQYLDTRAGAWYNIDEYRCGKVALIRYCGYYYDSEELLRAAGISAAVSACANVFTACAGAIFDYGAKGYASTDIAQSGTGITPFTQAESGFATAFYGVIDDIIAYEASDELMG